MIKEVSSKNMWNDEIITPIDFNKQSYKVETYLPPWGINLDQQLQVLACIYAYTRPTENNKKRL